ncbi:MAG TPA: sensor histidine kinase [Actinomycetes bacterium]|nr:sensor histidine kinase [Actinomycetes bacterium]
MGRAAGRPGGSRAWLAYLAAGAAVALAYYLVPALGLVPRWAAKIGLYNVFGLSAVVAIVAGVRRYRPERPLPWALFAVGLLSYATADVIFYTYQDLLHRDVFPSVADVFYLAAYPFLMAGVLLLIRGRRPGADRASLLDALTVTVGVAVVAWVFLIVPFARAPGLTLPERLVSMAYPVMDVLLAATVIRLLVDRGPRPPAYRVLLAGVGALLVTDTLYTVIQLGGGYHTGSPIDVGWMTWYACWGAAALHPTMRSLADPAPPVREVRLTRGRLGLLAGASLLAPAMEAVQLARGEHGQDLVIVLASMVLFALVLARLHGMAGQVASLAGARKRLLDRTVQAREEERVRLAAELHDGPIQRLAGIAYAADLSRRRIARGELAGGRELLATLEDDIRGEVAALRRVMTELRPPALDEWGLPAALSDYAAELQRRTGIACSVQARLPVRLARAQETVLYRVAQEALTNVAKHARAGHARVTLRAEQGQVVLEVADDGVGFASGRAAGAGGEQPAGDHYGLASMRQQVEMAGGSWRLRSRPGHGTTVTATLPMAAS